MRLEVLVLLSLIIAFVVSWLFIPAWGVSGRNYYLRLMPWGFVVTFFGVTYVVPPPTVYLVSFFALDSALILIIWRRSAYALYLSALLAVLSLVMLIDTILFQQRYLQVRGFIIVPTPSGYVYIELPHNSFIGLPTYVLIVATAIAILNMLTRARWLGLRRWSLAEAVKEHGAPTAIEQALDRLGIPYTKTPDGIAVGNLLIKTEGNKILLSRRTEGDVIAGGSPGSNVEDTVAYAIYESIREALKGGTEVVEYAEE
ncbi:hypothetical protein [Vulcanisaeta distributa]|uniref:Uncharacterized protein n=1 Tax=Vulcanisaeta distributa (strain DSM 14429 / JCM 11212 / NBRC 100878 / IC-017) TaxID=572478 RepID=E1QQH4_VULDI|nr:hypothetical protein [Vulcanisaeta distributa]ADN50469.1 conserved hypothetical protein [Vulcanisaeta distributa DSM 14429]